MADSLRRTRTHSFSDGPNLRLPEPPRRKSAASVSTSPSASTSAAPVSVSAAAAAAYNAAYDAANPSPATPFALHGGTFLVDDPPPPPPPLGNVRDSFVSIVDDPFFQRYHGAVDWHRDLPPADRDPDPGPGPGPDEQPRHDPSPTTSWPPPRRESLTIADPTPWSRTLGRMDNHTINIAVIGADGVGKSAFIQAALRMPRPPTTNMNGIRLDVEGIPHIVTLIELDLEYFDVDLSQQIRWPKQVNGYMVPRIDGALILYDVMNKDSIRELPPTLSALGKSGLPTILVATKCDNPESSRQLNADGMAMMFPSVMADFKTSSNVPGSTRDCLQAIIRAAISARRGGDKSEAATRRRAASSAAHLDTPPESINGRPLSEAGSKHSRASSDLSLLRGFPPVSAADREGYYRGQNSRSPRIDYPTTPQLAASSFGTEMTDENQTQTVSGMLRSTGVRLDAGHGSFLDVEESDGESFRYSDDIPILQRNDETLFDKPAKVNGVTFDELVDRLLSPKMTRADHNFAEIFLCLYRKFAAPNRLFTAILERMDRVKDDKTTHYLARSTTQLRIVEVIAKWVSAYPGDFARPSTKRKLQELIDQLSTDPIFAVAAMQMRDHLVHDVCEDDDTDWARADEPEDDATGADGGSNNRNDGLKRGSELSESMKSLQMDDGRSSERRPSGSFDMAPRESDGGGSGGGGAGSAAAGGSTMAHFQFHSFEDYEREAATMVPAATLPLSKLRYRIFMALDTDDIADEMTRIDWIMFSSIRIRDLVRHVSLPLEERDKCRSLQSVNRMINHFNHVAKWVANMILIRDKAKHRGPCLQKFMRIALRLRALNNYNGLAAVLAGINGTAVHRLAQTRALVDADTQKKFARLVLLMGTQKSHFAYRLAWENSPPPRIPFMPLHRRDLVSAEEGSRTFVGPGGDRINWKKFDVLGEVLLPIMRSQGTPYPNLKKDNQSRELILDCRMPTDDEEIYQRSVQVEPSTGPADTSKKKLFWLPSK